jgi:putative serine protease PepD
MEEARRKSTMNTKKKNEGYSGRIVLIAIVLVAGAYLAGARWGPREPISVGAVPLGANLSSRSADAASLAQRDAALTDDESINVKVYRQASPAVANILTKATEYDFFMDPVPVEGAGSGFVIDSKGYILTNNHVVEGAQSIEVVLGDQTRYAAKFIGADPRNDVALIKIEPKGKPLVALPLGDSSTIQVGQKVLAIGNPFGSAARCRQVKPRSLMKQSKQTRPSTAATPAARSSIRTAR